MNLKEYTCSIKKNQFRYIISKKIAKLIDSGLTKDEIGKKCIDENLIEIDSIPRRKELTNVIFRRLKSLDEFLLKKFIKGDVQTSKIILVYAILITDELFYDFMEDVFVSATLSDHRCIKLSDYDIFFTRMKEENIFVSKWSKTTIEQLSTGYRNILVESNLANREKKILKLNKVIIDDNVIKHIEEVGDKKGIQIILGKIK